MVGGIDAIADPCLLHPGREVVRDEHMVDAALARESVDLLGVAGGDPSIGQVHRRAEPAVVAHVAADKRILGMCGREVEVAGQDG